MATKKTGTVYIGTSNIVIPGNKQSFPGVFKNKSRLHYYSTLFNSLEINSSFYKIPMPVTFKKWANDVGDDFKFSVKLWKEITHAKNLDFKTADISRFLQAADQSGKTSGPLLIQFPGKIGLEHYNKVETLLREIILHKPSKRVAVEFRHPDWYGGEGLELLDEYGATLVLHDIPKSRNAQLNKRAEFVYLRFHGIAGDYRGSYNGKELEHYAMLIKGWASQGKDVFAYFNNTIGAAYENARSLQKLIKV